MKVLFSLSIEIKKGIFQELIKVLCLSDIEIRKVDFISVIGDFDKYIIKGVFSDQEKFKKIVKQLEILKDKFRNVEISNDLQEAVEKGILQIKSTLPFDKEDDYQLNGLGVLLLQNERISNSTNPEMETGIKRSSSFISVLKEKKESERELAEIYAHLETAAVIGSSFSKINAFPLVLKYEIHEDLIKTIKSIEKSFSSIRLLYMDDQSDIGFYTQIFDSIKKSILSYQYDELPCFLLSAIRLMLLKHSHKIEGSNIGFIGLDTSVMRITPLLKKIGVSRVLGYDSNEKTMLYFERNDGLATTPENILSNCDVVVMVKGCFSPEDLERIRPNLLIISLLDDVEKEDLFFKKKSCRKILRNHWFDAALLYPHLLEVMVEKKKERLEDDEIILLSEMLDGEANKDIIYPSPFVNLYEKIKSVLNN